MKLKDILHFFRSLIFKSNQITILKWYNIDSFTLLPHVFCSDASEISFKRSHLLENQPLHNRLHTPLPRKKLNTTC